MVQVYVGKVMLQQLKVRVEFLYYGDLEFY